LQNQPPPPESERPHREACFYRDRTADAHRRIDPRSAKAGSGELRAHVTLFPGAMFWPCMPVGERAERRVTCGEVHALVSHTPGPLGSGDIESFSANHSPGTLAAVEWFTQPHLAQILVSRLRKANGEIPRYFQIVLDVTYKDTVPTEVSYVMHRELQPRMRSNPK